MSAKKSNSKFFIAIILTALIVGSGVYFWQNSTNSTKNLESLTNRIKELEKEDSKQEKINQDYENCIKNIDTKLEGQALEDAQFKCDSALYDAL